MSGQSGDKETIQVKRRRQGASSGPVGGRGEISGRQRPGGGGPTGGGSSGGGVPGGGAPFGGGGRRTSGPKLPWWAVLLLIVGFVIYSMMTSGDGGDQTSIPPASDIQEQTDVLPADVLEASPTPRPTRPAPTKAPAGSSTGEKWTVLLYQDADDQILESDIFTDLNEVERIGSTDRVQIVAQIDRFRGAFTGDGDWTSTRRYFVTQDDDLNQVNSELVEDMGEENMAEGKTLSDFVAWAAQSYPADHYVLILSDHGMGWPGGFSDPAPGSRDPSRLPLAGALSDDQLYMMELEDALADIQQSAGIVKFDIIGMDACLMGHLEVLAALEPYAQYAVLSQETEPALGWAYTGFLRALVDNPDMSGADLAGEIVRTYIQDDQRIQDDQARADFLRQGSPMGGLFGSASVMSAEELAQQMERSVTLTAVDLAAIPDLIDNVNSLAYTLQSEDQQVIASARTYAPSFTNVFGKGSQSPYIDLGGFVQMLKREGGNTKTGQAADGVLSAVNASIVAEKHGSGKRGATGISIYFPNSTLYSSPVAGPKSYTGMARRFASVSLWDDFLAFHYSDVSFKPQPAEPVEAQLGAPSRAPGLGQIQVSPITLSGKTASPGNPVTLTAEIQGQNIGYIYLFVGYYDKNANAIFQADTDYLESAQSQELNGVFYPRWSENAFDMVLEWDPTLFQITDGDTSTVARFTPLTYGASAEDAVYTVDGIYHYADGTSRSARLYFRNGVMQQVFGFTDENATGGVREIIPQAGDTFTIYEKWLDLDSSGKVSESTFQEGATLTFGDQPFRWEEVYAPAGQYVVGFIVEDRDGNTQEVYTTVTVQ